MRHRRQSCEACGARVRVISPYLGHKRGCAVVAAWRLEAATTAAAEAVTTMIVQLLPPRRRPLEVLAESGDQQPALVDRTLECEEVDPHRHLHCQHYDRCLDVAVRALGKTSRSWVCPGACTGRQTWVAFPKMKLDLEM